MCLHAMDRDNVTFSYIMYVSQILSCDTQCIQQNRCSEILHLAFFKPAS
jgi:hypothetical protein